MVPWSPICLSSRLAFAFEHIRLSSVHHMWVICPAWCKILLYTFLVCFLRVFYHRAAEYSQQQKFDARGAFGNIMGSNASEPSAPLTSWDELLSEMLSKRHGRASGLNPGTLPSKLVSGYLGLPRQFGRAERVWLTALGIFSSPCCC